MQLAMSVLLVTTLFILFWLYPSMAYEYNPEPSTDEEKSEFLRRCPSSTCGSQTIRFPLRLRTSPPNCSLEGLDLSCSGNATPLLNLPSSPHPLEVIAIDYEQSQLRIDLGPNYASCPLPNISFLSNSTYTLPDGISLLHCSKEYPIPSSVSDWIFGPISCPSSSSSSSSKLNPVAYAYAYAVEPGLDIGYLPSYCIMGYTTTYVNPPFGFNCLGETPSLVDMMEDVTKRRQANLLWCVSSSFSYDCRSCERYGMTCGFSWTANRTFCIPRPHHQSYPSSNLKIISGISVGGFVIFLSVVVAFIFFHISRKSVKERETRLKVERFLATYKTTKPKRYTFSETKKITKHFSSKLGQGGFGSVYKGELPGGIPVAIKMLETSKGEEFINEVATIGRIHHDNVVCLLGFCSEGTRHALIYEFMPKGSLEKLIFWEDAKTSYRPLSMEKLLEIAIGIARGVEYLHQGCEQRILHFDIKPHNILLDHNFKPKISDFGLAKLYSRDRSFVTLTAARGTMGYVAPEIYSRNFGTVSYKSDVYSFGMLLMEMVSGKRNVDPAIGVGVDKENQSDVYFPEWVYDQLVNGDNIGVSIQKNDAEEEIVKKLLIVALWCIQWSPTDRPSMTRVIRWLTENTESLQIPPKPFVTPLEENVTFAIET